ncbi:hypothetical protein Rleg5DRAFT_0891 [Rhizobium leguminosarum bv. viciae WSM1455]|nr:hypothetical protein Rleg5DRAFT_0891 [Rhizobium leguminosarum bv. viciae WSM1455]
MGKLDGCHPTGSKPFKAVVFGRQKDNRNGALLLELLHWRL